MLTQLYNGRVLTPEGWINEGSVIFNGSRIVEIKKSSNVEDGITNAIDIKGKYIVPGGIELHCHGGGGSDFMEATPEAFKTCTTAPQPSTPRCRHLHSTPWKRVLKSAPSSWTSPTAPSWVCISKALISIPSKPVRKCQV